MADTSIFGRLKKLFSTNAVVRNVGGKKLDVVDTGQIQAFANRRGVDRYNRIYQSGTGGYGSHHGRMENAMAFQGTRLQLFRDYDAMDNDSIISSVLDIYADECVGPETRIPLLNGTTRTIKDLYDSKETDFWVYSIDETGVFTPAQCERVAYNGLKEMYRITLDDGTQIEATANHLWITPDQQLVHTSELKHGTVLCKTVGVSHNEMNTHQVVSVEYIGQRDAYDLVNVGNSHIYAIESNDGTRIFCHNCTVKDEFNRVLNIKSDNTQIKEILDNLFYDILNIEFNLWPWTRNVAKYGDFFLYLDIDPEYGVVNALPLSVYETMRVEGEDPKNPFSVRFTIQNDFLNLGKKEFDNYEIAHFRLLSDTNFLPYGKAMVEGGRRVWKQLQLMEDAMLIHRIMRAPDKRKFKIDIGNIPPAEVETYMQRIVNTMKKVPLIDPKTGDYNLRYNMMNITEDFYLPVRGRESGTEIDTMQGLQFNAIEDIEYLRNKLMAAFKVPKAFLGYEEDLSGKASLAAQDVRFARTIERIQRIMVSELTKIAIIHLYVQGFTDADLVNFELSLSNPSTLYEQEKMNLWQQRFQLASSMTGNQAMLLSQDWVYKNILEMSEDEIKKEREGIIEDMKRQQEQQEAAQPAPPPQPTYPEDGQVELGPPPSIDGDDEDGVPPEELDDVDSILASLGEDIEDDDESLLDEADLEETLMKNKGGRPKEGLKFGTDRHPLGRDPLGHKEIWKNKKYTHRPMSLEARNILQTLSKDGTLSKYRELITEQHNIVEKPTIFEE